MGSMSIELFNAALPVSPAAYAQTSAFHIEGERFAVDVELTVGTAGPVDFYLEYSEENPSSGRWFREIAEEDQGGGVTEMPLVVRTLRAEGSPFANLAAGTHRVTLQFIRTHKFGRINMRMRSGAASARIVSVFGVKAVVP